MAEFHEYWLELHAQGLGGNLEDYCLEWKAAKQGKFATQVGKTNLNYAYHLNATAYAQFLRGKSEALGVRRVEGKIATVNLSSKSGSPQTGNIESLELESGVSVSGDFFIDCTGFRGLLIGEVLGVGYEDWSHWLAADSAWAVQTESTRRAAAVYAGNGASHRLAMAHSAAASHRQRHRLQQPLLLRRRGAIAAAQEPDGADHYRTAAAQIPHRPPAATLAPQLCRAGSRGRLPRAARVDQHSPDYIALIRLMRLFPFSGEFEQQAERFNTESKFEWEEVRDFIILHYKQTRRDDSPMWNYYRNMEVPRNVTHRIEIFRKNGYVWPDKVNLFRIDSWLQVMMGQGVFPEGHHGGTRIPGTASLQQTLARSAQDGD